MNRVKQIFKYVVTILIVVIVITLLFKIKIVYIDVEGLTKYEKVEFIDKIFPDDNSKISIVCFVKDKIIKHKKMTYISSYEIKWKSPVSVVISVTEQDIVAYVKKDIKNAYFDREGIIEEISDRRINDVPEILGLNCKITDQGNKIIFEDEKMLDIVLEITSFVKDNNLRLELVDIDSEGNFTLYMGEIKVLLGEPINIDIKLKRLNDIYKEISTMAGTLDLSIARENMEDEEYIFKKDS